LYLNFRPFSDKEAWGIFKIAAFGEAIGWTLLISGILISQYLTPGNNIAVQIAGHMHGTFFIIYIAIALVVAPSMRWKPLKILIAGLMSIPPYGTLMFELWQSHNRKQQRRQYLVNTFLFSLS
jgi:integral membrane protein